MLNGKRVAVVVPAYNEETQIVSVLETMPSFVDRIVIVNDCSKDTTSQVVLDYIHSLKKSEIRILPVSEPIANRFNHADMIVYQMNQDELTKFVPSQVMNATPESDRVILINHLENGGVGAAIARGYKWCKDHAIDCTAVMAGDGQMDPGELENICAPVISENVDYVKGNRLIHRSAWVVIPKVRFFGNSVLSLLTKLASGYWRVSDTQTGFTAISLKALNAIDLFGIYRRYGMPNDMLVKLNIAYCTLREVEIKPVYRVGEQSKMKIGKVIPTVSWLLIKNFFKRVWTKYLLRDFHPLFLLYHLGLLLILGSAFLAARLISEYLVDRSWTYQSVILFALFVISGFQSLLFAMWMDIQDNERLYR